MRQSDIDGLWTFSLHLLLIHLYTDYICASVSARLWNFQFEWVKIGNIFGQKIDRSDVNYFILRTDKVYDTFETEIFGLYRFG